MQYVGQSYRFLKTRLMEQYRRINLRTSTVAGDSTGEVSNPHLNSIRLFLHDETLQ